MATYKITLVALHASTATADIDISVNGGAVTHITGVAGLPVGDAPSFIAAGEQYAIAYYNGLAQSQAVPTIDPSVTALVGQSATVVV